jgi:hypothetical protein
MVASLDRKRLGQRLRVGKMLIRGVFDKASDRPGVVLWRIESKSETRRSPRGFLGVGVTPIFLHPSFAVAESVHLLFRF